MIRVSDKKRDGCRLLLVVVVIGGGGGYMQLLVVIMMGRERMRVDERDDE